MNLAGGLVDKVINHVTKPKLDIDIIRKYRISFEYTNLGQDSEIFEGNIWVLAIRSKPKRARIIPTKSARECSTGMHLIPNDTAVFDREMNLKWKGPRSRTGPLACMYKKSIEGTKPERKEYLRRMVLAYINELTAANYDLKDLVKGTLSELLMFFTSNESSDTFGHLRD